MKRWIILLCAIPALAQVSVLSTQSTATQIVVNYNSPVPAACSFQAADMNRSITIASSAWAGGVATITTTAPHGLLVGSTQTVYIENSGSIWNGWQTATITAASTFTFSASTASATAGNVGVLVDDANPTLYSGANLDSRAGSITNGTSRTLVIGYRSAPIASDGNRYTRALQANTRHVIAITCGAATSTFSFSTQNVPLGNTYNLGIPVDSANPGQYGEPTIQWPNANQALIDPTSGIRSVRVTQPAGTASALTVFGSAAATGGLSLATLSNPQLTSLTNPQLSTLPNTAWANQSGPLTSGGGNATWAGPCGVGTCPLFLSFGSLSLPGGAYYYGAGFAVGSSLDWLQVTALNASISGSGGTLNSCITIDSVTCASGTQTQALTSTPSTALFGTTNLMDLWQGSSGPPAVSRVDVSQSIGTAVYTAGAVTVGGNTCSANCLTNAATVATNTFASGPNPALFLAYSFTDSNGACAGGGTKTQNCVGNGTTFVPSGVGTLFNVKWGSGSTVTVAGTPYTVASVQNEGLLTLATFPGSNLTGAAFAASNGGVLLWANTPNTLSVGYTTFKYGSTAMPQWPAASANNCSPQVNNAAGTPGYDCFIGDQIWWFSADGNIQNNLGLVASWYYGGTTPPWNGNELCGGNAGSFYQFDPIVQDTWYCLLTTAYYYPGSVQASPIVKVSYSGSHSNASNAQIPDCALNGNTQPCLHWTLMETTAAQTPPKIIGTLYPLCTGTLVAYQFIFDGVSSDSHLMIENAGNSQNTGGCLTLYDLGDRTPEGTDAGSMKIVANATTFTNAPWSWCTIHDALIGSGWAMLASQPFQGNGANLGYTMSMTSAQLNNTTTGTCPMNPFGLLTGCISLTVTGEPTRSLDSTSLKNLAVGDLIQLTDYGEMLRVVDVSSFPTFSVQRGYQSTITATALTTLLTVCGMQYSPGTGTGTGYWNYIADPTGSNSTLTTMIPQYFVAGHSYLGGGCPATHHHVVRLWGSTSRSAVPHPGGIYSADRASLLRAE